MSRLTASVDPPRPHRMPIGAKRMPEGGPVNSRLIGDQRGLDEDDMALVDAIHVNPRASYEQLGEALGMSPVTAARRWAASQAAGWPGFRRCPGQGCHSLGRCSRRVRRWRTLATAASLADMDQVFSVHVISGPRQLYAFVVSDRVAALARLLLDRMAAEPGLRGMRTSVTPAVFRASWRLGAISSPQADAVRP
jgi:DNA-binding Lrp family transcriptional regulator